MLLILILIQNAPIENQLLSGFDSSSILGIPDIAVTIQTAFPTAGRVVLQQGVRKHSEYIPTKVMFSNPGPTGHITLHTLFIIF